MPHYPESVKAHMSQQALAELEALLTRFEQNGFQSSCFTSAEKARFEQLKHDYNTAEATAITNLMPN